MGWWTLVISRVKGGLCRNALMWNLVNLPWFLYGINVLGKKSDKAGLYSFILFLKWSEVNVGFHKSFCEAFNEDYNHLQHTTASLTCTLLAGFRFPLITCMSNGDNKLGPFTLIKISTMTLPFFFLPDVMFINSKRQRKCAEQESSIYDFTYFASYFWSVCLFAF